MSTATPVPETWNLTGDDARETLLSCGRGQLLKDAFMRMRVADGFSHARSLAYTTSLLLVEAIIAVVGLASALGERGIGGVITRTLQAAVPGPGGELLTDAVQQAHSAGASHRYWGLIFGLIGALITGTTQMGQLERGLNRMYGVEQDRPTAKKYGLALLLTVTAGILLTGAFALLAFGHTIGGSIKNSTVADIWSVARWPVGLVFVIIGITLVFLVSPNRRQPGASWLAFGATVSVGAWALFTIGLASFFSLSKSFGETYGPLAGMIALLIWALLSGVAMLFGGAVAAQLEAVRAGASKPQDEVKVHYSEPDSVAEARPLTPA